MTGFVLRRLIQTLVVIGLLSFFCYFLMTLMPGDPIDEMIASNPNMTSEDAQRLRMRSGSASCTGSTSLPTSGTGTG